MKSNRKSKAEQKREIIKKAFKDLQGALEKFQAAFDYESDLEDSDTQLSIENSIKPSPNTKEKSQPTHTAKTSRSQSQKEPPKNKGKTSHAVVNNSSIENPTKYSKKPIKADSGLTEDINSDVESVNSAILKNKSTSGADKIITDSQKLDVRAKKKQAAVRTRSNQANSLPKISVEPTNNRSGDELSSKVKSLGECVLDLMTTSMYKSLFILPNSSLLASYYYRRIIQYCLSLKTERFNKDSIRSQMFRKTPKNIVCRPPDDDVWNYCLGELVNIGVLELDEDYVVRDCDLYKQALNQLR